MSPVNDFERMKQLGALYDTPFAEGMSEQEYRVVLADRMAREDPVKAVEILTGKSEKAGEWTDAEEALVWQYQQTHSRLKEQELATSGDTYYNMPYEDILVLLEREGFDKIYETEKMRDSRTATVQAFANTERGFLVVLDTYDNGGGKTFYGGDAHCQIAPTDELHEFVRNKDWRKGNLALAKLLMLKVSADQQVELDGTLREGVHVRKDVREELVRFFDGIQNIPYYTLANPWKQTNRLWFYWLDEGDFTQFPESVRRMMGQS